MSRRVFASVCLAAGKDSDDVIDALQEFVGGDQVNRIYSDKADELINSYRYLRYPREQITTRSSSNQWHHRTKSSGHVAGDEDFVDHN